MSEASFEEYLDKFKKVQEFIINDLKNSSIKAQANFLVAMGLFNYIEILGSFNKHNSTDRFNFVFNELLSKEYKIVFEKLNLINSPYNLLRCGMSHEYFVKMYVINNKNIEIGFTIYGINNESQFYESISSNSCGLEFINLDENKCHINVHNSRFIHDLDLAFEEFKKRIAADVGEYKSKFLARCREIRLERFQ
jgi:hypothetical protein